MTRWRSAVHRTILVVDVEGYGNAHRTNDHRLSVRHGMYEILKIAFARAGLAWDKCDADDCGDGVMVLAPPDQPKSLFAETLPGQLVAALREHNGRHAREARIRLRVALHAGEVHFDEHGVAGAAINFTFRLIDAAPLRDALARSPGVLAMVVSGWFFEEVVQHCPGARPASYQRLPVEVKETNTIGWFCLPDQPDADDRRVGIPVQRSGSGAASTWTLPRDTASFTGRAEELTRLATAAREEGGQQVVGIQAIDGMAGIGKTSFAIHAAHQLVDRFPDAQLFLRLHAHTPGQTPVNPTDALASLLTMVGVDAQHLPADLDSRAAMWRDRIAGKRVLLVLDDADSHRQVEPLLPATPGCLVLVTSRRRLTALDTTITLSLDTLPAREAADLFTSLSRREVLGPQSDVLADVIRSCGHLPLAISLLAGRLRDHPMWTIEDLAGKLHESHDWVIRQTHAEEVAVTAAFHLSYRNLRADRQRFFRYISLHPGTEFEAASAAALADVPVGDARTHLDNLYNDHLLNETAPERYRMHDLVREYSRTLLDDETAEDRDKAVGRLLDHYKNAATAADQFITQDLMRDAPRAEPRTYAQPGSLAPATRDAAWKWMHTESANLLACARHAAAHALPEQVVGLAAATAAFLDVVGPWDQAVVLHRDAAAAARGVGDDLHTADALYRIGRAQHRTAEYPAAISALSQALEIYDRLDHELGQVGTLMQLGRAWRQTDEYVQAAKAYTKALSLSRSLKDRTDEACALNELGIIRLVKGEYAEAISAHSKAWDIYAELKDRTGQADAANELGVAKRMTGDYTAAIDLHTRALDVYRDLRDGFHQALALNNLGTALRAKGEPAEAIEAHQEALAIAKNTGDRIGQAIALNELGAAQATTVSFAAATASHDRALALYRMLGQQLGVAETLNHKGTLLLASGNQRDARAQHEMALEVAREISTPLEEARALAGLGWCAAGLGDTTATHDYFHEALAIYDRLGAAERFEIARALAGLAPAHRTE
ncbi:tetratricopeptide repeat protein [Amycolatopsis sp. SID8362]|uniref:ATP-binding protein n=1 Tax=Amycolatopsis sp. SID8362 TaxID=2690346 RepID=UPI00136E135F|nr:tetratricopeptide repeat protein [Amycolatopsis sp. SID8362]NBH05075.1 tetratricopeptide repeat protein [Amycolatopsis sp. SID8362]NED41775.1 tetratricopeptide repeat protein [Amycolatopsis sp. SID8362]